MRKRKYLIGATLALAASVAVSGVAQAAPTAQQLIVTSGKSKQDRKIKGPADINVTVNTTETPGATETAKTAATTNVDFDKDFAFTAGTLPQCDPAILAGTTTEQAKAACPGAQVGSGDATLCSAVGGCGIASLPATVTAFNGVPSGGNQSIILHTRVPGANTTTVLTGVLTNSPLGSPYGKRLVVTVPDTAATGLHLTHFFTGVPVTKSGKKPKKKKGKKAKPAPYYVSANCSDKTWSFREDTTFRGGGGNLVATTEIPCTQKKAKKKK
jgi:hypothetical protein